VIRGLEGEAQGRRQGQELCRKLKEELQGERVRVSQLELQVQNKEYAEGDMQSQIRIMKKKDEMRIEKIRSLELVVE
jgi:hypothetical protein